MTDQLPERSIGYILRQRRESLSLSLDQISKDTKIRKEFLEAIERDDFSIFDSHVYTKGFIKNFAHYLGIDSDVLLAIYRRDYQNIDYKRKIKKEPAKEGQKESSNKFLLYLKNIKLTKRNLSVAGITIGGIFVVFFVLSLLNQAFAGPYLKVDAPIEVNVGENKSLQISDDTIKISGEVAPYSVVRINEEPIILKTGFQFESESFPITSEKNLFIISATNQLGIRSEIRLEVIKGKTVEQSTTTSTNNAIIKILNNPTFLIIRGDGVIKYNDQAFPRDSLSIDFEKVLEIETSSPSDTLVEVGGQNYQLSKETERFEYNNGTITRK